MLQRMETIFAVLVVATVTAPSFAYAEKFICKSSRGFSAHSIAETLEHNHRRYAPVQKELGKRFGAYFSSFDSNDDDTGDNVRDFLAVPNWVSYELKGVSENENGQYLEPDISIKRPSDWYKAPTLSFLWTNRTGIRKKRIDNSYDGIGKVWNRGHLAMADHAQRISWQASCNTHYFWNAVPQAADMNQGPWRHLEDYSAAAANKYGRVWIIAGPIFKKQKPIGYIGETEKSEVPVAVPHSIFKIIVRNVGNDNVKALAFIFHQDYEKAENGQPAPVGNWVNCSKAKKLRHTFDHRPRIVSIRQIEKETGYEFFPSASNRNDIIDEVPPSLWLVERKYWNPKGCAGQNFHPD